MIAVLTGFVYVHFTMSYMKKKTIRLKVGTVDICLSVCILPGQNL